MGWRAMLRTIALGAAPGLLMGCVVALWGSTEPQRIPLSEGTPTEANLAARAELLRRELSDDFTVLVAPPFVVVGDGDASDVQRAARSVRGLVGSLRDGLFEREPGHIIDVWLFADTRSYVDNARALLGEWPPTVNGYYAPRRHAVIVNAASGDDTLMHEVVHPLLAADCPKCPVWFDEGLAGLYEHSAPRDGASSGPPDERLPRLQRRLRHKRLPSLAALTVSTSREFYEDPAATNYAQARYLLLYLQHEGQLPRYYLALKRDLERDPSGFAALRRALGGAELQSGWESFVLALR